MNLIRSADELQPGSRKVSVAVGVFDGIHLGHQQVIRQAIDDAHQHEGTAVAVTFDRHPNEIVAPQRTPPLIYPLSKKLRVLESLGIDTTLLIRFDEAFSKLPPDRFIRRLARDFRHIYSICVGSTFTFGHQRRGNVDLLRTLGEELHFIVHGLAAVALDGERVSSTRVRHAIRAGRLDAASQMLGRAYSLCGTVIRGDNIGSRIGFPTANLDVRGLVLPPSGVYAAHAEVRGQTLRAVLNIGYRPTLESPTELRVETHLLEFSEQIYDEPVEMTFVEKLREEIKFDSLAALKLQIARDIRKAKKLF